jgi:hypothetical protein
VLPLQVMSLRLRLLTFAIVVLWLLAGPIAMAFDACAAMMATCEAPCGVASCAAPLVAFVITLAIVAALTQSAAAAIHSTALGVPELPPRSPLRSA